MANLSHPRQKPEKSARKTACLLSAEPGCGTEAAADGEARTHGGEALEAVEIGDHRWMVENLDVNHFRNGDPVPHAQTKQQWEESGRKRRPAWCYYENDPDNGKQYGRLYNWYAVTDPRGLAPGGWHIPGKDEWANLADSYGGRRKAGSELKSTQGWGSRGNGTNESGFTGLAGGMRTDKGAFQYSGIYGYWWSQDELNDSYAYYRYLYCNSGKLFSYINCFKSSGFSVRCVRD